jgi:DNA-binding HxlR family transcriptional regulator
MTASIPLEANADRSDHACWRPVAPLLAETGGEAGRSPRPCRRTPLETALDHLEGRRRLLLVWHLFWGPRAFGELLRLTEGTTTKRSLRHELQGLEACGLLRKERCSRDGRRAEYRLTPFGETLKPLVGAFYLWGLHVQESRSPGGRRGQVELTPVHAGSLAARGADDFGRPRP